MPTVKPSIKIPFSQANINFANALTATYGARLDHREGDWLVITMREDDQNLIIPRHVFDEHLPETMTGTAEDAWRSLILYRTGRLLEFAPDLIVIGPSDAPALDPGKIIQVSIRTRDAKLKEDARHWAQVGGFRSLNEYLECAVLHYNEYWSTLAT